ncbi:potassium transporter TrkG [Niallia sp. Krafla_26]
MIELLGAVGLGTYFLKYFPTWQKAYLQGFFASVAASTNAGFDITGKSLIPFTNDYFVLTLSCSYISHKSFLFSSNIQASITAISRIIRLVASRTCFRSNT